MTTLSDRNASTLWILLLTAASTATTIVLACATPFPALAALAAAHMHKRDGVLLMLVSWAASQAVGFGVHGYPHSASTFAWAAALATGAVGAVLAAYALSDRLPAKTSFAKLFTGYAAAFIGFKFIVFLWALGLGGIDSVIAPPIVARQLVRDGAIMIGLFALYHALVAIGVPAARRQHVAA